MSLGIAALGLKPTSTATQSHRKAHLLKAESFPTGIATEKNAGCGPILKDLITGAPPAENSKPGDGVGKFKPAIPKWVSNDRQVMRFWGYYIENPRTSSEKVQKVALLFYMVDHAIQIDHFKDEEGDEGA
jgi:hypothetical protein